LPVLLLKRLKGIGESVNHKSEINKTNKFIQVKVKVKNHLFKLSVYKHLSERQNLCYPFPTAKVIEIAKSLKITKP
jgi:predicted sulfurtransferase